MRHVSLLFALVMVAGAAEAATSPAAGRWEGRIGELPAVTLDVVDQSGKLSGTATFYLIRDDGDGPRVAGEDKHPLVNLKFQEQVLSFDVAKRDGEVIRFRMKIISAGVAELAKDGETETIRMMRVTVAGAAINNQSGIAVTI